MRYATNPNCSRPSQRALGQTDDSNAQAVFAVNPNDPNCLIKCRDKYCGQLYSACYGLPRIADPDSGPTWCEQFADCYYGNCNRSCTGAGASGGGTGARVSLFSPFGD